MVKDYPPSPPLSTLIFHCRRMAKMELTQFQLLEDFKAAKSLDEVHDLLGKAEGFRDAPGSFQANKEKEKKDRELRETAGRDEIVGLREVPTFRAISWIQRLCSPKCGLGLTFNATGVCCFFCTHLTEDTWLTTWNV